MGEFKANGDVGPEARFSDRGSQSWLRALAKNPYVGAVAALCLAAALALLATGTSAGAGRLKPITGKLTRSGYTLIALAADGRGRLARARRGSFRLVPPAGVVSLQLRAKDGSYAGPIVVGRAGHSRVLMGVRSGARLGSVVVRAGYAKLAGRLPQRFLDPGRWARARRLAPIGNGRNFGLVRSRPRRHPPPGDLDADGVPDPLDVDVNGNLILNNLDRSSRRAHVAQAQSGFGILSALNLGPGGGPVGAANANARRSNGQPAFSDAEIGQSLASNGWLNIGVLPGNSVELDCSGLSYCSAGGTGRVGAGGVASPLCPGSCPTRPPFPGSPGDRSGFDPDGDGFGTLVSPSCCQGAFFLGHGARPAEFDSSGKRLPGGIGTGDFLTEWVANGVPASDCPPESVDCIPYPTTLQYVFATVPALVSYDDGQGHATAVSYPAPPITGCVGCPPGPPGAPGNGFPVSAPTGSDVIVTLTFWRPQRKATPADPPGATWIDVGHLNYGALLGPTVSGGCPSNAFLQTNPPDPNLVGVPTPFGYGDAPTWGFTDQKSDQPADPSNTLTYRLNLSRCLAANGRSFNPGDERTFSFIAQPGTQTSGSALVQQDIVFKRE